MAKFLNALIRYSFYLLFFLIPLIFFSGSFELFEYNKMMLTYAITVVIATTWLIKVITGARATGDKSLFLGSIRRTPFDIPILLYLASHVLSTIFSLDPHTSIWGYYSRFHEGLIATISYIVLYYAAVSNLNKKDVFRIFIYSFASGVIVSLWGAMEHFGASPSCQFITGKFDDSCWIQDVKGRVFATLGQPNWMAAYLDILILASIGFVLKAKDQILPTKNQSKVQSFLANRFVVYVVFCALFFAALLFTKSRSGILGLIVGLGIFGFSYLFLKRKSLDIKSLIPKQLLILLTSLVLLALFFGLPFAQIDNLNLESLLNSKSTTQSAVVPKADPGYIDIGVTESGDIRKIVWKGALKIWQRYPIFGSGVETFAYAYYLDRPVEHNMVSEWDFLYNKAHNEFLNILATTGTVGMLAYLGMIGIFCYWYLKKIHNSGTQFVTVSALFAAYASILVTNFFGFSVVIIGVFFFLLPAFSLILEKSDNDETSNNLVSKNKNSSQSGNSPITTVQWIFVGITIALAIYMEWALTNMWTADKSFAYGKNLDGVSDYTQAYTYLNSAVTQIPDESTYRDELSYNEAVIALALFNHATGSAQEKLSTPYGGSNISAATLVQKAVSDSNQVIQQSPNILQYWKTRTKVFYSLAQIDKQYLLEALNSIQKAQTLAPTDAKVHYNFALLLGQAGQIPQAIQVMQQTTQMKPDYADAHYALGLYYDGISQKQKAREQMEYMLKHIGNDDRAKKWLEENK